MFVMDAVTQKAIKKFPHRAVDIAQSYDWKQVQCKEWLCDNLELFIPKFKDTRIYIAGGWYGNVLLPKLKEMYPKTEIRLHDIDEETINISKNIFFKDDSFIKPELIDSSDHFYKYFLINTSCEHMAPLNIKRAKPGGPTKTYVALQSNDYIGIEGHVNCVKSATELAEQYEVKEIYYQGSMVFDKYTRYMVIGRV